MEAPLEVNDVDISEDCVGSLWVAKNLDELAQLAAIVALGQATKASLILSGLGDHGPESFTNNELIDEAISTLTLSEQAALGKKGYPRYQRDGFLFEVLSWIAALNETGGNGVLKDPHIRSTTQGVDGLYLQLDGGKKELIKTIIFEDKCSENPKHTFAYKVMPSFKERHSSKRNAELVSIATTLLKTCGLDAPTASKISGEVLSIQLRHYRASLAITNAMINQAYLSEIFDTYHELLDISKEQRMACVLPAGDDIRGWFNELADRAISYLNSLRGGVSYV